MILHGRHSLSILTLAICVSLPSVIVAVRRLPAEVIQTRIVEHSHERQRRALMEETFPDSQSSSSRERTLHVELPKSEDHLVTSLPYLDPDAFPTKHYAGHIPASHDDDKKFFYWLFEPDLSDLKKDDSEIPLLIWLNGGPGCSSMDGLWLENGPFRLTPPGSSSNPSNDWSIKINPYSWHKSPAWALYIDQPVGTGLSFTKKKNYCKNDLEVDIDFHLFLENFLLVHRQHFLNEDAGEKTQLTMSRPLYFSGESHAGHYIPSMMDYILKRNDDHNSDTKPRIKLNLKGAAIGNGWVDPYYQYAAADAAYGVGMIDLAQKEGLDQKEAVCRKKLENGQYANNICFDLMDDVIKGSHGYGGITKVSSYDNRLWEQKGVSRSFPLGHKDVEAYLGGWRGHHYPDNMSVDYEDVLKALHAEESIEAGQKYKECTDPPYNALSHQDGLGVRDEVVRILNHGDKPRLLFFNGVNDMICNHVGNEKFLDNLPWNHKREWILAKRSAWDAFPATKTSGPAGYMKEFDNLLFLKIMEAGHMVPMDLPDVSLEMMRVFMFSGSFSPSKGDQRITRDVPGSNGQCDCPQAEPCKEKECPSCDNKSCDCPTCPTQTLTQEISCDDDVSNETRKQYAMKMNNDTIRGGWIGAFIGVGSTVLLVWFRNRRQLSGGVKMNRSDTSPLRDQPSYTDNPELELT